MTIRWYYYGGKNDSKSFGEKQKAHFGGHYIFLKRLPASTLHLVKHPTTETGSKTKPNSATRTETRSKTKPNSGTTTETRPKTKPNSGTTTETRPKTKPNSGTTIETRPETTPNSGTTTETFENILFCETKSLELRANWGVNGHLITSFGTSYPKLEWNWV
jgi:hypothetical protein